MRSIKKQARVYKERSDLNKLASAEIDIHNLKKYDSLDFNEIFHSQEIFELWKKSNGEMDRFGIPDDTGGVNLGDRRAIFYLIAGLRPKSVLEIGTHIGASTINIASALSLVVKSDEANLTTVDIRDVNSTQKKPWLEFGVNKSPKEMVDALGLSSIVKFKTDTSLGYAEKNNKKFDLIFLDGDHSAKAVYQEIPVALHLLNPGGVILLHDFFPKYMPLWSNGSVIPGPFMAVQRIINEGHDIRCHPLGTLPWPTKLGSSITSLAVFLAH